MMGTNEDISILRRQGHVVIFPGPSPGLFGPFVQILYILDSNCPGLIVTCATPSRYFADLTNLRSNGALGNIDLRLEEIPGTIPTYPIDPQFRVWADSMSEHAFLETEQLRRKLAGQKGTPESPTAVISDLLLPWSKDFADEMQIPCYPFYHCGPVYTMMLLELPKALKAGFDSRIATNEDKLLRTAVPDFVKAPIMSFIRVEDYPTAFFNSAEYFCRIAETTKNSAGILLNSAEALDASCGAVSALKELLNPSKVFCIGPRVQIPGFGHFYSSSVSIDTVLPWLNSQRKKSVLYVAFGSLGVMSKELTVELASGLEASGVPFLWVVKTDPAKLSEVLPPGFQERTAGRGLIETGWVAQAKILQHSAIGGYLTHCGWNSTLEGICSNVPFIAWPFSADQPQNARYLDDVTKMGIAIAYLKPNYKHNFQGITRREVKIAITKLMIEEEGQKIRANVENMQRLAKAAIEKGGSSYQDLHRFLNQIT